MMHAYVIGLMHEWVLDPGAYDLLVAAPTMIETFVAGLQARPPRRSATERDAAAVAASAG